MIGNCNTRGQNIGLKGLSTDSPPHPFPNREPVHRLTQAALEPESSKHLLVVINIAIDHIFKTVSQLLSLGYSLSLNLLKLIHMASTMELLETFRI